MVVVDWSNLLLAYLHDALDEVLSIRGHVPRTRDNARIAVGQDVSTSLLEAAASSADPLASMIERLPMPLPQTGDSGQSVQPTANCRSRTLCRRAPRAPLVAQSGLFAPVLWRAIGQRASPLTGDCRQAAELADAVGHG
jgi:hypothetical protein